MKQVIVLQHAECEAPGLIARVLEEDGCILSTLRGDAVPSECAPASGLVIMGGPMGVHEYERFPFLRAEMRLIECALREEKPVLGVCLGSQLLASALGANVRKGEKKEIGWRKVTLAAAARTDALLGGIAPVFMACHWHGDVYDLPCSATHLASSELTAIQAFRYGTRAYGFLFHMEMTPEILRDMTKTFADELRDEGLEGAAILREAEELLPPLQAIGKQVFGHWAKLLLPGA